MNFWFSWGLFIEFKALELTNSKNAPLSWRIFVEFISSSFFCFCFLLMTVYMIFFSCSDSLLMLSIVMVSGYLKYLIKNYFNVFLRIRINWLVWEGSKHYTYFFWIFIISFGKSYNVLIKSSSLSVNWFDRLFF